MITGSNCSTPQAEIELHDSVECPSCGEVSPILTEFKHCCVYCGAILVDHSPRIERRYEVEIKPVNWTDGTRALARVKYLGAWLNCFRIIDTGHPDDPTVEAPMLNGGHNKKYPLIYFEDPNDITDIIVSIVDEYYRSLGLKHESRPVGTA